MAGIIKGLTGSGVLPSTAKTDLAADLGTPGTGVRNAVDAAAALSIRVNPQRLTFKPQVSASYRAKMPVLGGLTNGTDTGAMTRVRNVAPYRMTEVRLGYSNVYQTASREAPVPNPITVRAAIEYGGLFFPVYLNGSRDATIASGGFLEFEPVFVDIPKGGEYFIRTLVTVTAGGKWPYGVFQGAAFQGDGVEQGTSVTDKTTSGTVTASNNYAYGPSKVAARRIDNAVSITVVGDSIAFGQGDSQDRSMVVRASDGLYPVHNLGYPGAQAKEFVARYAGLRMRLAVTGTHWIVQFGTNDINASYTAAEVQASLQAVYQLGADLGMVVWGATLPPRTTTTDAWATTGGQTKASTETVRVAVNNWIRTNPAPLSGHFDVADQLETGRNTGIWKPDHTSDGIHPNQTGQAAGANAFNLSILS